MTMRRFAGCEDAACVERHAEHFHAEDWDAFWNELTADQKRALRDKAVREHMSISAVAIEWGAPA